MSDEDTHTDRDTYAHTHALIRAHTHTYTRALMHIKYNMGSPKQTHYMHYNT